MTDGGKALWHRGAHLPLDKRLERRVGAVVAIAEAISEAERCGCVREDCDVASRRWEAMAESLRGKPHAAPVLAVALRCGDGERTVVECPPCLRTREPAAMRLVERNIERPGRATRLTRLGGEVLDVERETCHVGDRQCRLESTDVRRHDYLLDARRAQQPASCSLRLFEAARCQRRVVAHQARVVARCCRRRRCAGRVAAKLVGMPHNEHVLVRGARCRRLQRPAPTYRKPGDAQREEDCGRIPSVARTPALADSSLRSMSQPPLFTTHRNPTTWIAQGACIHVPSEAECSAGGCPALELRQRCGGKRRAVAERTEFVTTRKAVRCASSARVRHPVLADGFLVVVCDRHALTSHIELAAVYA
mmetsp:Transcript_41757/g.110303  ORF Transcript_41757/g.110303 Transcript_41757/m.110303 type:complete len:363 (-) Transcript_41757:209-1297(-)